MNKTFKIILTIIAVVVIVIIVKNSLSKQDNSTQGTSNNTESIIGCYVNTLSKDVYTLVIQSENGQAVTGMLSFNNFEKDSSVGTINGAYSNGILIADYTFNSEGMQSVRQVIFKMDNGNFIEGFGPVKATDNREYLVDTLGVTYDTNNSTFVKTSSCPDFESDIIKSNVLQFGSTLKMVSLLATADDVKKAMDENYTPYVATDTLMKWEADPSTAPAREVSSPWPDHIVIDSVNKIDANNYEVKGSVIEMVSGNSADDDSLKYAISIKLEKIAGDWMITEFQKL